jgi:hypothetical protein
MSFDEVVFWLLTAMSWTAVAFLFWTLAAVVRKSLTTGYSDTPESASNASGMTPNDPGPA